MCVLRPAPPYFMLVGLSDLKKHVLQIQKLLGFFKNLSSTCYVLTSFPEIFWFFLFDGGIENHFRGCFLARGCILMFPFENYSASAPRLLSDTSKTAIPGLQPRGVSKIHTVKINLRALHPSAGLTLTL